VAEFSPKRVDYEDAVRSLHENTPLAVHLGIILESVRPGKVTVDLELQPHLVQQHDYAHAGLLATLADVTCGLAAYSLMDKGEEVLSVNMNVSLMRPARSRRLRACGWVVKASRHIYFTEAEIRSVDGGESRLTTKASIVMTAK